MGLLYITTYFMYWKYNIIYGRSNGLDKFRGKKVKQNTQLFVVLSSWYDFLINVSACFLVKKAVMSPPIKNCSKSCFAVIYIYLNRLVVRRPTCFPLKASYDSVPVSDSSHMFVFSRRNCWFYQMCKMSRF